jgi:hypothetical protein
VLQQGVSTSSGYGRRAADSESVIGGAYFGIEEALRVDVPCGKVVSLSYSQRRSKLFKGYCQFFSRRLLVFARTQVFLTRCQPLCRPQSPLVSLYDSPTSFGSIVYGSFVNDHKSNHFVTVNEAEGTHFVRTFTLTEDAGPNGVTDKPSCLLKTRSFRRRPEDYKAWFKERGDCRRVPDEGAKEPLEPDDRLCVVREQSAIELKELKGQKVACIRLLKNVTYGQAELLLTTDTSVATVTILNHSVPLTIMQNLPKPIRSLEYWTGNYFVLHDSNLVAIYKRSLRGQLEEVRTIRLSVPELGDDLNICELKVPALEWSDRLTDVLHKELPRHLLLVGKHKEATKPQCCLIKYDISKGAYSTAAIIDTTATITCLTYGPYDNGPVMVGLDDGRIMVFDYYTLELLLHLNVGLGQPVKWITYEPGSTLIVGTDTSIHTCDLTDDKCRVSQQPDKCPHIHIKHSL